MAEKDRKKTNKNMFINRELSWLAFNERVLEEAYEHENPILERVKFLAITASNLDEFFMVRVAGIKEQVRAGLKKTTPDGLTPPNQLHAISERAHEFSKKQYNCLSHALLPTLKKNGVSILKYDELNDEQKKFLVKYFDKNIFPVLTPLAIDRSRPFPMLLNRSVNIAVRLKQGKETHFAVVQVPSILPRFTPLPCDGERAYIMLEDVIIAFLPKLFDSHEVKAVSLFRITRNGDLTIDEEAVDLMDEIQKSIKKRKRGRPVRLEITTKCDREIRSFLIQTLDVKETDIYKCSGVLDLTCFFKLVDIDGMEELKLPPITSAAPKDFLGHTDYFAAIRERDRFVHHPYESFDCVVKFLSDAAEDPDVLAIKQTLYRVSGHSPIISALMRAAENGKQVTVLVELKARFDEENNINWARKLEQAGCHVIYGLTGLKTHCKILLVVRHENNEIRRYLHLGTGNYNDSTAKLYTDMGLFTCREEYGEDATLLFNLLTGYSRPPKYSRFITAPDNMRDFFKEKINSEIKAARDGKPCGIIVKVNSLLDEKIIRQLYKASCAGVPIKLIVRGICALAAGVPGISENIEVHSIVGRFLEHSRIFLFVNSGNPEYYLGSADWMPRNLDRRVELVFPVDDKEICSRLEKIITTLWEDTINTRRQLPDGSYELLDRRSSHNSNAQEIFYNRAVEAQREYESAQEEENRYKPKTADGK